MEYRYFAFMRHPQEAAPVPDEAFRDIGMRCLLSTERMLVFGSQDTPALCLTPTAILIGNVFTPSGAPVDSLPLNVEGTQLLQVLLEDHWGDYVLIEAPPEPRKPARILRSPSGGVGCVHSLESGRGFVTSDVAIAVQLGLFRRTIDWHSINHFLVFPQLRTERTGLVGLRELLPGCALEVQGGVAKVDVAWSPWKFVEESQRVQDRPEAVISIKHAVTTAVRSQASLDRRVLLELSGGLDSSIIGACLAEGAPEVVCCTLTTRASRTDERPYARKISDLLGVELEEVSAEVGSARVDFPVPADSVAPGMGMTHYVTDFALQRAADRHSTDSYMSGAGGDTVFCYLGNASPAADAFRERGISAGYSAIRDLAGLYGCTLSKAARLALRKMRHGPKSARPPNTSFLTPLADVSERFEHPWLAEHAGAFIGDAERIGALVGTQGYADGMARNRQRPMRFPLLSQPVMEACLRVPTWMWISGGRNRAIARDAFADMLPEYVLNRRSKGTYVNMAGSIYERNKPAMLRFLEEGCLSSRQLLDVPALRRVLQSEVPTRDPSFFRIFDLCMIENWIRHQGETFPPADATVGLSAAPGLINRQTLY